MRRGLGARVVEVAGEAGAAGAAGAVGAAGAAGAAREHTNPILASQDTQKMTRTSVKRARPTVKCAPVPASTHAAKPVCPVMGCSMTTLPVRPGARNARPVIVRSARLQGA